jgi:hypothetical protein
MMAKLGSFDDLPSNAQGFLTSYRTRLETMSEAESTAMAVREIYSAYYSEMGGVGAAPERKARTPTTGGKVRRFQKGPRPQPSLSAARHSTMPMIRKSLPALVIFASMMALIVAYIFLTQQRHPRIARVASGRDKTQVKVLGVILGICGVLYARFRRNGWL